MKMNFSLHALIRESECIGCTKCIKACPVDAIIGAAKVMHTVATAECTGCELCVPACPVDCIDLVPVTETPSPEKIAEKTALAERRGDAQKKRLSFKAPTTLAEKIQEKKAYIQAALARVKAKKLL